MRLRTTRISLERTGLSQSSGDDLDKAEGLLAQWEISKNAKTCKLWHRVKKLFRLRTID